MNRIIRLSVEEYRRQLRSKRSFLTHTEQMAEVIRLSKNIQSNGFSDDDKRKRILLLLTMPLFEVAWADGKINGYEQDAILQVADIYNLIDDAALFHQITNRLGARPHQSECQSFWEEIKTFCLSLDETDVDAILFCLREQTEFIASQSQRWALGYWKGLRSGESEREILHTTAKRLDEIKAERPAKKLKEIGDDLSAVKQYEKLNRLVPLVKVAWADGQVTKREKHLVLQVAARNGIHPDTEDFKRLESWLELHPTDEFYDHSLELLCETLQKLPKEERDQWKFDLLADCADVAAVSGGSSKFSGGGARVCDEEIVAVKRIATKLSGSKNAYLS